MGSQVSQPCRRTELGTRGATSQGSRRPTHSTGCQAPCEGVRLGVQVAQTGWPRDPQMPSVAPGTRGFPRTGRNTGEQLDPHPLALQRGELRLGQGQRRCPQRAEAPRQPRLCASRAAAAADRCPRGELSGRLKCGPGLCARWAHAGTATRALNIHSLDRALIKQSKVHYYLIKFFIGSLIGLLVVP